MPESQVVVAEPSAAGIFLVLLIAAGREQDVLDALTEVGGIRRSVGFRVPEAKLGCVVGIGSDAWDRLYPGLPRPAGLHQPVGPLYRPHRESLSWAGFGADIRGGPARTATGVAWKARAGRSP